MLLPAAAASLPSSLWSNPINDAGAAAIAAALPQSQVTDLR
jgi:hypothetical protein